MTSERADALVVEAQLPTLINWAQGKGEEVDPTTKDKLAKVVVSIIQLRLIFLASQIPQNQVLISPSQSILLCSTGRGRQTNPTVLMFHVSLRILILNRCIYP